MLGDPGSSTVSDLNLQQQTIVILPPLPSTSNNARQLTADPESPVHQVLPEMFWKNGMVTNAKNFSELLEEQISKPTSLSTVLPG